MKARSWSAIAADRPVATWMATVAIVVFGLVSLGQLPLALLPDLSYPTITVRTTLTGPRRKRWSRPSPTPSRRWSAR